MSEKQVHPYPVRLTPELRERLEDAAKTAGRSLNAEMLLRLEASFFDSVDLQSLTSAQAMEVRRIVREELAKTVK